MYLAIPEIELRYTVFLGECVIHLPTVSDDPHKDKTNIIVSFPKFNPAAIMQTCNKNLTFYSKKEDIHKRQQYIKNLKAKTDTNE